MFKIGQPQFCKRLETQGANANIYAHCRTGAPLSWITHTGSDVRYIAKNETQVTHPILYPEKPKCSAMLFKLYRIRNMNYVHTPRSTFPLSVLAYIPMHFMPLMMAKLSSWLVYSSMKRQKLFLYQLLLEQKV